MYDWDLLAERLTLGIGTDTSTPDYDFARMQRRDVCGGLPFVIRRTMLTDAMEPFPGAHLKIMLAAPAAVRHQRIIERDRVWGTRVHDRWPALESMTERVKDPPFVWDLVLDGTTALDQNAAVILEEIERRHLFVDDGRQSKGTCRVCMEGRITSDRTGLRLTPLTVANITAYYTLFDRNLTHLTQHGDYRSMLAATTATVRAELEAENDAMILGLWLDRDLIGRVDLIPKGDGQFVIGYWLDHGAVGHGYMTSACRALISHARADLGGIAIYAGVTKGNQASEAVPKRLGFAPIQDMGTYMRFRLPLERA